MAKELGMSPQRCMREHTSREFVDWQVFLLEDINDFHREDYFWARIAQILTQANSEHPDRVKLEPFLLKFKEPEDLDSSPVLKEERGEFDLTYVSEVEDVTEEEVKVELQKVTKKMDFSKQVWGVFVGLDLKGK